MLLAGLVVTFASSTVVWLTTNRQMEASQHEYARAEVASLARNVDAWLKQIEQGIALVAAQPVIVSGVLGDVQENAYFVPIFGNLLSVGTSEVIGLYDFALEPIFEADMHGQRRELMAQNEVRALSQAVFDAGSGRHTVIDLDGEPHVVSAAPVLSSGLVEGVIVGSRSAQPMLQQIRAETTDTSIHLELLAARDLPVVAPRWTLPNSVGNTGVGLLVRWDETLMKGQRTLVLRSLVVTIGITVFLTGLLVAVSGQRILVRPVEDLKSAKTALEKAQAKQRELAEVVELANEAIVLTDRDGHIVWMNPAFARLTGYRLQEVHGRRPGDFLQGQDTDADTVRDLTNAICDQRSVEVELLNYNKSGAPYWVNIAITPIFDDSGELARLVAFQRDVTEKKSIELKLRDAIDKAEAANRSKSRFLANMSHEIRTPMNGVIGMTEALLDTEMSHEQRDAMNVIRASGKALVEIINDILDFSKLESGHINVALEVHEVDDLLYEVSGLVKRGLDKPDVLVEVEVCPEMPRQALVDIKLMRQALLNVIGNAYKFTERGRVHVSATREVKSGSTSFVYRIKDTGVGIPQEKLKHVFEAFKQVDNSKTRRFDGSGLGLAITKGLIEAMGGTISATSRTGEGAVFTIKIPVIEPAQRHLTHELLGIDRQVYLACEDDGLLAYWQRRLSRLGAELQVESSDTTDLSSIAEQQADRDCLFVLEASLAGHLEGKGVLGSGRCFVVSDKPKIPALPLLDAYLSNTALLQKLCRGGKADKSQEKRQPLAATAARVLAVEDNKTNRMVLKKLLEFQVTLLEFCENGLEAVETLTSAHDFDVVLMDISMPIMGGIEATQKIRMWEKQNNLPAIPIIAATANVGIENIESYRAIGMFGFVPKPFKRVELIEEISRALQG